MIQEEIALFDVALRNIWQRKTRSLLTGLGIAAVVMLYLWTSTITNWYDTDLRQQLSGMAGKVMVRGKTEDQSLYATTVIPQTDADALLKLDGVDTGRSTPVLLEPLVANPAPGMPPLVQAVGIFPGKEETFTGNARVKGEGRLKGPDDVVLGSQAAQKYGKSVGDQLQIQNHMFRIVGVMEPVYQVVDGAVMMPLETAQRVFVRPGVVTQLFLVTRQADQVEPLATAVRESNSRLEAMTSASMARTAETMLEAMRGFFGKIKGSGIAVALIVITIVMNMAVSERKREIGTLKAIGASASTIVTMIVIEAVLLSLTGGLLAIPATWLMLRSDNQGMDLMIAGQALLFCAVTGAVSALWPAWAAARVDPLESLRYE